MAEGGEKLYFFFGTRAMRPQWFAKEVGIKFDLKWIDLTKGEHKQPDFLKINPQGALPTLVDGAVTLTESAAILLYLARKYHKKIDLGLSDTATPVEAAHYYEALIYAPIHMDETIIPAFLNTFIFPPDKRDSKLVADKKHIFETSQFKVISKWIKGKSFIAGKFSIADIMVGYVLSLALRLGWLDSDPEVKNYAGSLAGRDGFKAAYDRTSPEYPPAPKQ